MILNMNERTMRSVSLFFFKFLENDNYLKHFIATNYHERVHVVKILNALLKEKKKLYYWLPYMIIYGLFDNFG